MTYVLSDDFSDPLGRWNQTAPWDGTEHSDSVKGFLTTQSHVDIRNFRVFNDLVNVPQNPDLDTVPQSTLDAEQQSAMEQKAGAPILTENWQLSGTGLGSLVVGKIASRGGWSGAQMQTTGASIAADLVSIDALHPVDISAMNSVLVCFPDYNTFDGTSYLQFTSDPNGVFGTGHDSLQVDFSNNGSIMPELKLLVSFFNQAGFDNTKITGVKLHLIRGTAPASGLTLTAMAMRAVTTGWTESALDFDTRIGAICVPVTLNASPYAGSVAQSFEFVRGDGTKLDPIPADGAYYVYFYPGGGTSPNDATGANHNIISVIVREKKDTADGTGQHIEGRIKFNDAETIFESEFVSSTGGSPGAVTTSAVHDVTIGGALDPTKHYVFRFEIRGTQVVASIYETDISQVVTNLVWTLATTISDSAYVYTNGRVGFVANLLSRDAYVSAFDVATTGFAVLQSRRYTSRTPVDGAQLAAVYAGDENRFQSVTGPDLLIDQSKTISGNGSFRTSRSIQTNQFVVDDWTQTYLSLAIFVPQNVTVANQPIILLNTPTSQQSLALPTLQPSQWNSLYFDLGIFRNLITAAGYSITISAAPNPDRSLGFFWVDDIVIGRRRVAWSLRATANGLFREFKNVVNDPNGALHFTPEERGTDLQLMAVALTEDAWVSSFKLFPRYAHLGLPVYDQGFETD